jgi:multidrug efflux pump subunit AcrA (membrane-fusion protein)
LTVAVLGILSFILAIPVTHKIEGQATLQPSVRRFVTAPFAGVLKTSLREPGDVVATGEILAALDGQEIAWTLAGLTAERNRLLKQKDISAASRDTAAVQVAELEIERVDAQVALQNYRTENLAIRSPIAGVVLSGDLKRVQGSPLTAGQSLFEIAPLSDMVVEVAVPSTELSYLSVALPMTLKLAAYPNDMWSLDVKRIHPKVIVHESATVIVVEGHLSNQDNRLRPGMRGKAQIEIGKRPLAWVLFYRAWADIRRWFML